MKFRVSFISLIHSCFLNELSFWYRVVLKHGSFKNCIYFVMTFDLKRLIQSTSSIDLDDGFFDLLTKFQSRRIDDQRCCSSVLEFGSRDSNVNVECEGDKENNGFQGICSIFNMYACGSLSVLLSYEQLELPTIIQALLMVLSKSVLPKLFTFVDWQKNFPFAPFPGAI